jgi:hypothetical protein
MGAAGQIVLDTGITLLGLATAALVLSTVVRLVTPGTPASGEPRPAVTVSGPVRIEVLNGCGVQGAARDVASLLRRDPTHDVLWIDNHHDVAIRSTVVLDRVDEPDRARSVARALGLGDEHVILQRRADERVEVTVVVGYDDGRWDQPLGGR